MQGFLQNLWTILGKLFPVAIRYPFFLISAFVLLLFFNHCMPEKNVAHETSPFRNLHDTIQYVGMQQCISCHQDIYKSFVQTGMGQSFAPATPQKSAAKFGDHIMVYDSISNFYYKPYWRSDSLIIKEFRLTGKDTIHQRDQYVQYIVGSGQHTNSHIFEENGYLHQAPITFYTQKGIWDLAPGFEGGFSSRFNRIIGTECMNCHNMHPNFVEGSENKFMSVPHGIECERCHGPGEVHLKEKLAGIKVDTATQTDYSIVNPANLSRKLEMNVCQRCHLQGVTVLQPGKDYTDFKPGMHLETVMDIFLPEFDGNETQFIMASQAHRLTKSLCYQNSKMTCISCHNPHISVKQTPRQTFNNACMDCHIGEAQGTGNRIIDPTESASIDKCSKPLSERMTANKNDCSGCHMPLSGSIDIPHVTIHDHFIRKPIPTDEQQKIENFLGLANVIRTETPPLVTAQAYLKYFESFASTPNYLDSARFYLAQAKNAPASKKMEVATHIAYLKEDYTGVLQAAENVAIPNIKDGWTAYRIGEAHLQNNEPAKATQYFKQALKDLPLNLEFNTKLGAALLQQNEVEAAEKVFQKVLNENENHLSALTNLGYVYVNLGKLSEAENLYKKALALNPDYEQALMNMAGLFLLKRDKANAQKMVSRVLKLYPNNEQARAIWEQLKSGL